MDEAGIKFLDKLYGNLYMSDVVQRTRKNNDSRTEAIQKYLDRLDRLHALATDEEKKDMVLNMYFDKYVIKEENIPWDQDKEQVIEAQKKKLAMWLSYLTDPTTKYPTWAKYWAFQGMLKMGSYDEFQGAYTRRTKTTVAPFVDPNPEIIAKSIDIIIKLVHNESINEITEERLSKTDSFSKIYTIFERKYKKNVKQAATSQDGIWIKYNQGSKEDAIKLCKSLENKNTGWCTADESTAISQVCGNQTDEDDYYENGGDFYVYYSKDKNGKYTVPRIAIRCEGKTRIGEIRGIEEGQNLEEDMLRVLENKLKSMDFLDKQSVDENIEIIRGMAELSAIIKKTNNKTPLTQEEVNNLYGKKKYGFGWTQDPRVEKILKTRNKVEDFDMLDSEQKINLLYSRILPKTFKLDDSPFLRDAIKEHPSIFRYANEKLYDDKDFVTFALTQINKQRKPLYSEDYTLISNRLRDDADVGMLIVKCSPDSFKFLSERLRDNEEILSTAILYERYHLVPEIGKSFMFASDRLKNDKEFVLKYNREHKISLLRYASDQIKDDAEVVLDITKRDGSELGFASERIRNDKEIVGKVLENCNRRFLHYASTKLRDDKEFILDLLENRGMNGINLLDASERMRDDEEIVISALKHAGRNVGHVFRYASPRLQGRPDMKFLVTNIEEMQRRNDEMHSHKNTSLS